MAYAFSGFHIGMLLPNKSKARNGALRNLKLLAVDRPVRVTMDIGFGELRFSQGKNRYAIKANDCSAVFCYMGDSKWREVWSGDGKM